MYDIELPDVNDMRRDVVTYIKQNKEIRAFYDEDNLEMELYKIEHTNEWGNHQTLHIMSVIYRFCYTVYITHSNPDHERSDNGWSTKWSSNSEIEDSCLEVRKVFIYLYLENEIHFQYLIPPENNLHYPLIKPLNESDENEHLNESDENEHLNESDENEIYIKLKKELKEDKIIDALETVGNVSILVDESKTRILLKGDVKRKEINRILKEKKIEEEVVIENVDDCEEDEVLNYKTAECVKKDSEIGKNIKYVYVIKRQQNQSGGSDSFYFDPILSEDEEEDENNRTVSDSDISDIKEFEFKENEEVSKKTPKVTEGYDFDKFYDDKNKEQIKTQLHKEWTLKRFNEYDSKFFEEKGYARVCENNNRRQPVVMNTREKKFIDDKFPGSYSGFIKTGSTKKKIKENYYICPDIWCPITKTSLTIDQFEEMGNKCPGKDETPLDFRIQSNGTDSYWVDKSTDKKTKKTKKIYKDHYPSFVQLQHSNGCNFPCCYKNIQDPKHFVVNRFYKVRYPDDKNEKKKNTDKDDKYISKLSVFIDRDKKGYLPQPINNILTRNGKIKREYVRKGTTTYSPQSRCFKDKKDGGNNENVLECIVDLLDNEEIKDANKLIDVIKDKLWTEPQYYLALNNGYNLKEFNEKEDVNNLYEFKELKEFRSWFVKRTEYISIFCLEKLIERIKQITKDNINEVLNESNDILREYIIYTSLKRYIVYIDSDIPKQIEDIYYLMRYKWLNPRGYNLIVLDATDEDTRVLNGRYFELRDTLNYASPFVFAILYKTLYYPMYENLGNVMNKKFYYKDKPIQNIVDTVTIMSSGLEYEEYDELDRRLDLMGYTTTKYVMDYNYKYCGVVCDIGGERYIGFKKHTPIINLENARDIKIIYISDVYVSKIEVLDMSMLKEDEVTILNIKSDDNRLYMEDLKKAEMNIDLFVSYHGNVIRTNNVMDQYKRNNMDMYYFNECLKENSKLIDELYYLRHEMNPLTTNDKCKLLDHLVLENLKVDEKEKCEMYRELKMVLEQTFRNQLKDKWKDILTKEKLDECIDDSYLEDIMDDNMFRDEIRFSTKARRVNMTITKIDLLRSTDNKRKNILYDGVIKHSDKMLKHIFIENSMKDKTEVMFDKKDIDEDLMIKLVESRHNPYNILSEWGEDGMREKAQKVTSKYRQSIKMNSVYKLKREDIENNDELQEKLIGWHKLAWGNREYNTNIIVEYFGIILETLGKKHITINEYKRLMEFRVKIDFSSDREMLMARLTNNKSFQKNMKREEPYKNGESIVDVMLGEKYQLGKYELMILAKYVGVNIIVWNKNEPDVLSSGSKYYTFLISDEESDHNKYHFIMSDKGAIVYSFEDIPVNVQKLLANKSNKKKEVETKGQLPQALKIPGIVVKK